MGTPGRPSQTSIPVFGAVDGRTGGADSTGGAAICGGGGGDGDGGGGSGAARGADFMIGSGGAAGGSWRTSDLRSAGGGNSGDEGGGGMKGASATEGRDLASMTGRLSSRGGSSGAALG